MVKITDNALTLLRKRYFLEGETTPEQMFRRVAKGIAEAEKEEDRVYWEKMFFKELNEMNFMPNSPVLMNMGTRLKSYSACYVLPVHDSIESIFKMYSDAAIVSKHGGGCGFDFSELRPEGDKVGSTEGVASGPLSWIKIQDTATDVVKQGGKRRGANLAALNIFHPDIEKFITAKEDGVSYTNFNFSVAVTGSFMKAVENDEDWSLEFNGKIYKTVKARYLWNLIIEQAWKTGEPGLLFIDTINKMNPAPHLGRITSTNPCGEQPLLPYESCCLASINLLNFVDDKKTILWDKLEKTVRISVRFLDNLIEVSEFPIPEIEKTTKRNRKIGLGIMGLADIFYVLGVRYDSEEARGIAKKVMNFICKTAEEYSLELGQERNHYPSSVFRNDRRNAALTSIQPTGSVSMIPNVSAGCEPNFALVYTRYSESLNQYFMIVNQVLERELKKRGLYTKEIIDKVKTNGGKVTGIPEMPEDIQKVFVTANEISPENHIRMQAVLQNAGVHGGISKTINLPATATVKDVEDAYKLAWKLGCKGITVYRDGSRENQVLSTPMPQNNQTQNLNNSKYTVTKPPMKEAYGKRLKVKTGCGALWLSFFIDEDGKLAEIWCNTSGGGCAANTETISRLTSLALRSNIDPEHILDQLSSAFCKSSMDKVKSRSCGHVIAKEIKKFLDEIEREKKNIKAIKVIGKTKCPDCGGELSQSEGCLLCNSCGYSKCG